jgi:hypothetical protein
MPQSLYRLLRLGRHRASGRLLLFQGNSGHVTGGDVGYI